MCIILYAPAGKTIKKQFIKNAIENNPDGAGIMFYDKNGKVNTKKGFFNFDDLYNFYKKIKNNNPIAIHCRIATSGAVSEKTCHPFEISKDFETMKQAGSVCEIGAFMHNGIINWCTPEKGMKAEVSDTMVFNKTVLYDAVSILENASMQNLLNNLGSRLLLFLNNQDVKMFGNWIKDKSGIYASNDSYKTEKQIKSYYLPPLYGYECNTLLCYEIVAPLNKKTEKDYINIFDIIPELFDITKLREKNNKYYFTMYSDCFIDDFLPPTWEIEKCYEVQNNLQEDFESWEQYL